MVFYQLHGNEAARDFIDQRMVLNTALREALISTGVKPQKRIVAESREKMQEEGYSWLVLNWRVRIKPDFDFTSARNRIESAIVKAQARPVITLNSNDDEIPLKIDAYVGHRLSHRIFFMIEPKEQNAAPLRLSNSSMMAKRWTYLTGNRLEVDRIIQSLLVDFNINGPPLLISEYWEDEDLPLPSAHWIIYVKNSLDIDQLQKSLKRELSSFASVTRAIELETAKTLLALRITVNGSVSHVIRFSSHPDSRGINGRKWKKEDAVFVTAPRVAIIIDDIGYDIGIADKLMRLGIPLTLSILPHRPYSTEIALRARKRNFEIMMHLPMEPISYPDTDPGVGAIMIGDSESEQKRKAEEDLSAIPYVAGVNNHMGSGAMVDALTVQNVLEVIRKHSLYFIDSRTTAETLGLKAAQALGIPSAERSVFIDSTDPVDIEYRIEKLREVIKLAREQGSCIAIGHPSADTLNALIQLIDEFRENGIELVFASEVVYGQTQLSY